MRIIKIKHNLNPPPPPPSKLLQSPPTRLFLNNKIPFWDAYVDINLAGHVIQSHKVKRAYGRFDHVPTRTISP